MDRIWNQEENLIVQSYLAILLFQELKRNNFIDSIFFSEMQFQNSSFKDFIKRHNEIDNQGVGLLALYAMLVVPKELIGTKFENDYDQINDFLIGITQNTQTNYRNDRSKINFLRHIRNAVAHARVSFREKDVIIFEDSNSRENFYTELPLKDMGEFLNRLEKVHSKYIAAMSR